VKRFQRDQGARADGIFDRWATLRSSGCCALISADKVSLGVPIARDG
jgi:hypothetical protein